MFKRLSKILRAAAAARALEQGKDDPLTPILAKTPCTRIR